MKKFLLSMAAVSLAAGAWAETYAEKFPAAIDVKPNPEYYVDVTPKNFNFSQTEMTTAEIPTLLCPAELKSYAAANLNSGDKKDWMKNELDYAAHPEYQDGVIVFGGAFCFNNDANRNAVLDGMSIYDFGGKIGKALVINGSNSTLADYLYDNFSSELNLEDTPVIPKMSKAQNGVIQMFWILDKTISERPVSWDGAAPTIRIRMEISHYNPTDVNTFAGLYRVNGSGTALKPIDNTISSANFRYYKNDGKDNATEFDPTKTFDWNPFRWMVYEFESILEIDEEGYSHVKMQIPYADNTKPFDNGAILIRNLKVYHCGHNVKVQHENEAIANETVRKVYNDFIRLPYSTVTAMELAHTQEDDLHLSAGEESDLILTIHPSYDDVVAIPNPALEFVTENNTNAHVILPDVIGKNMKVRIDEQAVESNSPVIVSVKSGDLTTNTVNIHHYAAPDGVQLFDKESGDEATLTFAIGGDSAESTDYSVFVPSIHDIKDGAYQHVVLNVPDGASCATVALTETGDLTVTPLTEGTMTFTLTPVLAGEHRSGAETFKNEPQQFTLTVTQGSQGVEIAISDAEGRVEYYNLSGVRVAQPAEGNVYIRRTGNTVEKVKL